MRKTLTLALLLPAIGCASFQRATNFDHKTPEEHTEWTAEHPDPAPTKEEIEAARAKRKQMLRAIGSGLQDVGQSIKGTHCTSRQLGATVYTDCN